MDRLVIASGAVPRDYLMLCSSAIQLVRTDSRRRDAVLLRIELGILRHRSGAILNCAQCEQSNAWPKGNASGSTKRRASVLVPIASAHIKIPSRSTPTADGDANRQKMEAREGCKTGLGIFSRRCKRSSPRIGIDLDRKDGLTGRCEPGILRSKRSFQLIHLTSCFKETVKFPGVDNRKS